MAKVKTNQINLGVYTQVGQAARVNAIHGVKQLNVKLEAVFDEERDKDYAGGPHREFMYCKLSGSVTAFIEDAASTEISYASLKSSAQLGSYPGEWRLMNGNTELFHFSGMKITSFTENLPVDGRATFTMNFTSMHKALLPAATE